MRRTQMRGAFCDTCITKARLFFFLLELWTRKVCCSSLLTSLFVDGEDVDSRWHIEQVRKSWSSSSFFLFYNTNSRSKLCMLDGSSSNRGVWNHEFLAHHTHAPPKTLRTASWVEEQCVETFYIRKRVIRATQLPRADFHSPLDTLHFLFLFSLPSLLISVHFVTGMQHLAARGKTELERSTAMLCYHVRKEKKNVFIVLKRWDQIHVKMFPKRRWWWRDERKVFFPRT
jgi:hypothetical protein